MAYVVYSSEHNTYECVGKNRNKQLWPAWHKLGTKVCRSNEANQVYNKYTYTEVILVRFFLFQLPQLPLTSWQSKKVLLVSESLGSHPLHWGIQLGTGSTIVVAAVAVWMLVVAPQTTTH